MQWQRSRNRPLTVKGFQMLEFLSSRSPAELLGLMAILGLVVVVTLAVLLSQWRKVREGRLKADLMRDLLARGLSVEEVERLSTPARVREAQIAAESKVRQAEIDADTQLKAAQMATDLKRDLLARGFSVEEIERLVPGEAAEPRAHAEASALANAIANMVHDSELDQDAVVGLLEVFLKKERTMENRWGQTKHAQQAAEAGREGDNGLSGQRTERQTIPG
jgi:hypothetical protein